MLARTILAEPISEQYLKSVTPTRSRKQTKRRNPVWRRIIAGCIIRGLQREAKREKRQADRDRKQKQKLERLVAQPWENADNITPASERVPQENLVKVWEDWENWEDIEALSEFETDKLQSFWNTATDTEKERLVSELARSLRDRESGKSLQIIAEWVPGNILESALKLSTFVIEEAVYKFRKIEAGNVWSFMRQDRPQPILVRAESLPKLVTVCEKPSTPGEIQPISDRALVDLNAIEKAQKWADIEEALQRDGKRLNACAIALYKRFPKEEADAKSREYFTLRLAEHIFLYPETFDQMDWVLEKLKLKALEVIVSNYDIKDLEFTIKVLNPDAPHTATEINMMILKEALFVGTDRFGNYIWREIGGNEKKFRAELDQIVGIEASDPDF